MGSGRRRPAAATAAAWTVLVLTGCGEAARGLGAGPAGPAAALELLDALRARLGPAQREPSLQAARPKLAAALFVPSRAFGDNIVTGIFLFQGVRIDPIEDEVIAGLFISDPTASGANITFYRARPDYITKLQQDFAFDKQRSAQDKADQASRQAAWGMLLNLTMGAAALSGGGRGGDFGALGGFGGGFGALGQCPRVHRWQSDRFRRRTVCAGRRERPIASGARARSCRAAERRPGGSTQVQRMRGGGEKDLAQPGRSPADVDEAGTRFH